MGVSTGGRTRMVLLSAGVGGDPRAAWFEPVHTADLVQAARSSGGHLVEVSASVLRGLDPELAAGQLMAPGRPSALPLVRRATFDALVALPPVLIAPRQIAPAGAGGPDRQAPLSIKTAKRTIKRGSIVLASIATDDGWWAAEVLAVEQHNMLRLRWRDFPGLDEFRKPVSQVAVEPVSGGV